MGCGCSRAVSAEKVKQLHKEERHNERNEDANEVLNENVPEKEAEESQSILQMFTSMKPGTDAEQTLMKEESKSPSEKKSSGLISTMVNAKFLEKFINPKQYILMIWSNDKATIEKYSSSPVKYFSLPSNQSVLHFSFHPVLGAKFDALPTVLDCIVFVVKDVENDRKDIEQIFKDFPKVWNKKILAEGVTPEIEELAHAFNLKVFTSEGEMLSSIYEDDHKFFNLVHEVFRTIDKDNSGSIDVKEIAHAFIRLGKDIKEDDIHGAMHEMDLDSDGVVTFQELLYWWRRGIQGAKSFTKLVHKWAYKLSSTIPGSIDLIRPIKHRGVINRKTYSNKLSARIGQEFTEAGLKVTIMCGNSAKKDQIVQEANLALGYYAQDFWGAVGFYAHEDIPSEFSNKLGEVLEAQLDCSEAATYDYEKIKNSIGVNMQSIDNRMYLGMWVDLSANVYKIAFDQLNRINDSWVTPVDESILIDLSFKESLKDMMENPTAPFRSNLQSGGLIDINITHWSDLHKIIGPILGKDNIDKRILALLLMTGNLKTHLKRPESLPSWVTGSPYFQANNEFIIQFLQNSLKALGDQVPLLRNCIKDALHLFKDRISLFLRYRNFGVKIEVSGEGLDTIISQAFENK